MRLLTSSIITAGLLASHIAAAQTSCARPAEKAAFDLAGLKSELMVTAITCHAEPRYNAFVMRFRSDLMGIEKTLGTYFSRTFGRHGQQEHDDYITSLANAQSESGIKSGTLFCDKAVPLFDEVMKVNSGSELPSLAASKSLTQPIALVECAGPATTRTRTVAANTPIRKP